MLAISLCISCRKDDSTGETILVPVKYYFSEEDESLLDYYYDYPLITFLDQDSNELIFTTDSLYRITMKAQDNLSNGEELSMRYSCQTDYFPNYSFNIFLLAKPENEVGLTVIFGTGTYWYDRHNDYILSWFTADPKNPVSTDTLFPNGHTLKYDFYDSLTLRSETFYNVFYIMNEPSFNTSFKQTKDCYYTNDLGVVAFENLDKKFWIRKD